MKRIYFDHAATTPLDQRVKDEMMPYFNIKFGNASSIHSYGREAKMALENSRSIISKELGASPEDIIFTSGGTESNNLTLKGIAFANKNKGTHIITSSIEHDCILNSCKWLENQGFNITYLPVDKYGIINPKDVEAAIDKSTILVSIMQANNEIGTIEPLEEIGKICNDHDVFFHTDACQSFTKVPLDVNKNNLDLVTINSHKIYGPKGVGALYIRKGTKIDPLMHGGGHERKLRSGTENVSGIVGFAKAVEISKEFDLHKMTKFRDKIIKNVLEVPDTRLNGHPTQRLCNNANFSFKYIEGESLLLRLDAKGVSVSTGSACSSNTLEPSHVLKALGLPPEYAHGSMRLTLGIYNKEEDVDYAVEVIKDEIKILRKISPFGG
ncbi:MAG: cysteine desulfurase family protein [Bacteroidales bacterium]|jgi:cysteine desulfurase|nr:cysteine desulfurase family protein [Bacteroidales bacterium]